MNSPPLWAAVVTWTALAAGFYGIERPDVRGGFPVPFWAASFTFIGTGSIALTGGIFRGALLAAFLVILTNAVSRKKFRQTGFTLLPDDLAMVLCGGAIVLWRDYRRYILPVLVLAAVSALAITLIARHLPDIEVPALWRWVSCFSALLLLLATYSTLGGSQRFKDYPTRGKHRTSTFLSACIFRRKLWLRPYSLVMQDVAAETMPFRHPTTALKCPADAPDIVLIHQESVFDPRTFGLPIEPDIETFLSPTGLAGKLHVNIFGGSSWQTEFTVMTGLPSTAFGFDADHVFRKGAGRFTATLPAYLADLGYHRMLASSYERQLFAYDSFYKGAGIEDRLFADDFGPAFDRKTLQQNYDDDTFFAAVLNALGSRRITRPLFLFALTNFNHGPHNRVRTRSGYADSARAFALAETGNAEYAEYYARLSESAVAYKAFRKRLTELRPGRPIMFVRYGDHQPAFARQLNGDHFTTFYAIEAHGFNLEVPESPLPEPLDVAFLGTLLLKAARLPLDGLCEARLQLMREIGSDYLGTPSINRARLHRTMIEEGLISVDTR